MNNRFKLLCGILICILLFSSFAVAGDQLKGKPTLDVFFINDTNTKHTVYATIEAFFHSPGKDVLLVDESAVLLDRFPIPPKTGYSHRSIPLRGGFWFRLELKDGPLLLLYLIIPRSVRTILIGPGAVMMAFGAHETMFPFYKKHSNRR